MQQSHLIKKSLIRPATTVNEKPTTFFEERLLDYHMIKRENQILRQENQLLRNEILKRTNRMEKTELLQLLEFQRMRIDNLEREYDQLIISKQDYPKSGVIDMTNSGALFEIQDKLEHSELRCKIL